MHHENNLLYLYSFYILRVKESMKGNYTTVLTHLDGYFIDFCLVNYTKGIIYICPIEEKELLNLEFS